MRLVVSGSRFMPKGVERGLPDPMVSIGYQNERLTNYTYGDSPDAQRVTK